MGIGSNKFRLQMLGLPIIETLDEFSEVSHLSKRKLYFYSSCPEDHYFAYKLPKKNGGFRDIAQPSRKLKAIQSWILRNILDRLKVSEASKGFKEGDSISHNAEPHTGANSILSIDLEDFFPSIKANKIYSVFNTLGYNQHISCVLTSLCTNFGKLPQGSPCSPYLSNLVCIQLDNRLLGYVGKRGITYTRYADDFSFSASGSIKLLKAFRVIEKIIEDEGFAINAQKTRLFGLSGRKIVTGLVVTEKNVGIGRQKYRILRSEVYNLTKVDQSKVEYEKIQKIKGKLAFVKSVDKDRFSKLTKSIKTLKAEFPSSAVTSL